VVVRGAAEDERPAGHGLVALDANGRRKGAVARLVRANVGTRRREIRHDEPCVNRAPVVRSLIVSVRPRRTKHIT